MKDNLNLRHLSHLAVICDCDLSVTKAAMRLKISQSVISRNINNLEEHFGADLFIRKGKRLVGLTSLGTALLDACRQINLGVENINAIVEQNTAKPISGVISIACTHLQARYILPAVMTNLRHSYPKVKLNILQGFPAKINELLITNQAELGICSEKLADESSLISVNAYQWKRVLIAKKDHPILKAKNLSLASLAEEQIITYVRGITGRGSFDETFARSQLIPNIVIAAADSDVIKEFTRLGLGVGIISEIAYENEKEIVAKSLGNLFKPMNTRIVYRHDRILTDTHKLFIKLYCEESKSIKKRLKANKV